MPLLRASKLHRHEGGFSILESTVALVIIFGVLLTLIRVVDTGVRVLVETRRQAAASALANELIERARSLEWSNIGLVDAANDDDCPGDPPADGVAGVGCPDWKDELGVGGVGVGPDPYTFEGREVVFLLSADTFAPFLSFHDQVVRDNTRFDRYLFVTSERTDPADPATERWRKITAIVQWTPPSGFRREVRGVTYASQFSEPSQPFLKGIVAFEGGFLSITGEQDVEGRGSVKGSERWAVGGVARPDLKAIIRLPGSEVSAQTDYVSEAAARHSGMSGEFDWSDGIAYTTGPETFRKQADDDFGSAIPENDLPEDRTFARWDQADPLDGSSDDPPRDLRAAESGSTADRVQVSAAQAWSKHTSDDLPYASTRMESAEAVQVWFDEYSSDAVRQLYGDLFGVSLADAPYRFVFFHHGQGANPALGYEAVADRFNGLPISVTRRVDVTYDWRGRRVYLAYDDVYFRAIDADFQGWVEVRLPRIRGEVHAGEALPPNVLDAEDLGIRYWDPVTQDYQAFPGCSETFNVATIGDSQTCAVDVDYTMPDLPDRPRLHYRLSVTVTVNPATVPSDTPHEVVHQIGSIVTGNVSYRVEDIRVTEASLLGLLTEDGLLYDVELGFGLGGVRAAAFYLEPD